MAQLVKCTASALKIRSLPIIDGSTEIGKTMIKDQTATVYGESIDKKWIYVDAPAARGWVFKEYTTDVDPDVDLPSAAWPKVPTGYDEIVRIFGTPGNPMCRAGRAKLPAPLKLSWANETVTVVQCHKLMEDVWESAFQRIYDDGLWALLENFGGIYNFRPVKGTTGKVSTHSWGIAGDFDTLDNALGDRTPEMDPRIIKIMEDHGFVWGGNFSRPDGMHFQYAKGY